MSSVLGFRVPKPAVGSDSKSQQGRAWLRHSGKTLTAGWALCHEKRYKTLQPERHLHFGKPNSLHTIFFNCISEPRRGLRMPAEVRSNIAWGHARVGDAWASLVVPNVG